MYTVFTTHTAGLSQAKACGPARVRDRLEPGQLVAIAMKREHRLVGGALVSK